MTPLAQPTQVRRLVALVRFLEGGGELTTRQLADRARVSIRTAQRLLRDASEFVPIERDGELYRREA